MELTVFRNLNKKKRKSITKKELTKRPNLYLERTVSEAHKQPPTHRIQTPAIRGNDRMPRTITLPHALDLFHEL